jgi:AcrR family transcriptional regulator
MSDKTTPLARALEGPGAPVRPTPMEAFRLARRRWAEGQRVNLCALAEELGVSRATLTRWVGNKELLLSEILWSLYKRIFEQAKAAARGRRELRGVDYLAQIYNDINVEIVGAAPFQGYLRNDPQFGLQALIASTAQLHERIVGSWKELLDEEVAAGTIAPQMDTHSLAHFIVRIGESSVFSDLICGREPVAGPSTTAFRLLMSPQAQ